MSLIDKIEKFEEKIGPDNWRRLKIAVLTAAVYCALCGPFRSSSGNDEKINAPRMIYSNHTYCEERK